MADGDFAPSWLSTPGSTIGDVIASRGLSEADLAHRLDVPLERIRRLINGQSPITRELAIALADVLGGSADFWVSREKQFRHEIDRQVALGRDDARKAWLDQLPVSDMVRLGWIERKATPELKMAECLRFFGTDSLHDWRERYAKVMAAVAFRASSAFEAMPGAVLSWLQFGKLRAATIECGEWNKEAFQQSLGEIKTLTRRRQPNTFLPKLREICARNGVAVVVARTPAGCHASGATLFMSPKKAMILLSFRHRSDDQFWFTFFHEAGHLILHDTSGIFIEDGSEVTSQEEEEANEFAANVLLSEDARVALAELPLTQKSIQRFAVTNGISRGIVVGQLQHMGRLDHKKFSWMKLRFSISEIAAAS